MQNQDSPGAPESREAQAPPEAVVPPTPVGSYEFNAGENVLFKGLALRMSSLGFLLLVLAAMAGTGVLSAQEPPQTGPGPQHGILISLLGSWDVFLDDQVVGTAIARSRLDDRFIEVDIVAPESPMGHIIYIFGFDRRHADYTVIAMDATGTYWVTARGAREGTAMRMRGQDEDPVMRSMGLDKEYVIVLDVSSSDHATIETRYVDTRTEQKREMSFLTFELRRSSDPPNGRR